MQRKPGLALATLSLMVVAIVGPCALLHAGGKGDVKSPAKIKVLIIDGENNHRWARMTPPMKAMLESTGRFSVSVSTLPSNRAKKAEWATWKPAFANYDVVVSNYNDGGKCRWPEERRREFEKFVSEGGGFVPVHAADNSSANWPEYNKMIGGGGWGGRTPASGALLRKIDGKWITDPAPEGKSGSHGKRWAFPVHTEKSDHPIMKDLPASWMHATDELYNSLRGPWANATVLASARSTQTGVLEPMAIVIEYGKGKVFHLPLGHVGPIETLHCVGFQTLLVRGTEYVATGKTTIGVPKGFPGLAEPSLMAPETVDWGTVVAKKPLKVFILVGQSNMQGHAKVSTFDYIGDDPKTAPLLAKMRDKDKKPRLVENTWISYWTQGRGPQEGEGVGQLTAGYGARSNPAEAGGKIGPEFTFGITVQEALEQPILMIKVAWGGKSLHTDFRPPSAGSYEFSEAELKSLKKRGKDVAQEVEKRRLASGVYYRRMMDHIKRVLSDPRRVHPGYEVEQGYEVSGFIWFQGWNDVVASDVYPSRGQPGGYDRYSGWMAQFIRDVRKDLGVPRLPFVIGVLGVNGPEGNIDKRHRKVHMSFRNAMAAPASLPEFRGNVVAVQTAPFWDMPLDGIEKKYGKLRERRHELKGQVKKGAITEAEADLKLKEFESKLISAEEIALRKRAASNAGYHYYGCAKIMARIGEAFAKAALELQPE